MSKKKFFCLCMAAVMCLSFTAPALAQMPSKDEGIVVTKDVVAEIALNWAAGIHPEYELRVSNIVPFFEIDGSILGYTASYFSADNVPFGYYRYEQK